MRGRQSLVVGAALALLLLGGVALGQDPVDLKKEIDELKQNQQRMQQQLQQIIQILQTTQRAAARPSGPDVKDKIFEVGTNPAKGEQTAALTLIEFTDYQ